MQWRLFADLADVAGDRAVVVSVDGGGTVADALEALFSDRPALRDRVLDGSGDVHSHLTILKNGSDIENEDGLQTPVGPDDELALFPPVSGGDTTTAA